jgi:hypothetical protein
MLHRLLKKALIVALLVADLAPPVQAAVSAARMGEPPTMRLAVSASGEPVVQVARRGRIAHARPGRGRPVARPSVVRPRPGIRPPVVVTRPTVVVRPWRRRPHYGRIVAGVVLGTIVVVAVARSVPPAPSPDVCWYWTNSAQTRGYWDYCQ